MDAESICRYPLPIQQQRLHFQGSLYTVHTLLAFKLVSAVTNLGDEVASIEFEARLVLSSEYEL